MGISIFFSVCSDCVFRLYHALCYDYSVFMYLSYEMNTVFLQKNLNLITEKIRNYLNHYFTVLNIGLLNVGGHDENICEFIGKEICS